MNFEEMPENIFREFELDSLKIKYKFRENIRNELKQRTDVYALSLLDKLIPGTEDLIMHIIDEDIIFNISPEDLWKAATKDELKILDYCGVQHDQDAGILRMCLAPNDDREYRLNPNVLR